MCVCIYIYRERAYKTHEENMRGRRAEEREGEERERETREQQRREKASREETVVP